MNFEFSIGKERNFRNQIPNKKDRKAVFVFTLLLSYKRIYGDLYSTYI